MFRSASGRDPIACIAFVGQSRQQQDAQAPCDTRKRLAYLIDVSVSGIVIIGHENEVAAAQGFAVFRSPLTGPARIAGRNDVEPAQCLNVLFALDDHDDLFERDRLDDARQVVGRNHFVGNPTVKVRFVL